jgi:hypothetical protein
LVQSAYDLRYGDGPTRLSILAKVGSSLVLGGVIGEATTVSRLGMFGEGAIVAESNVTKSLSIAEIEFYSKTKFLDQSSYSNPGILPNDLAVTFTGSRYSSYELLDDVILHRAGTKETPFGQSFTFDKPISEIQTRIDKAVKPVWTGGGTSVIDSGFDFKIPKGTIVHVGDVAYQEDIFLGGTQQIVVQAPWRIKGIEIVNTYSLQQEISWNIMKRK